MFNDNGSLVVTNCTFRVNSAFDHGGGMFNCNSISISIIVTDCTFYGNSADGWSGAIVAYYEGGNPSITNCIFWSNSAVEGPQIALSSRVVLSTNYCDIQGARNEDYNSEEKKCGGKKH